MPKNKSRNIKLPERQRKQWMECEKHFLLLFLHEKIQQDDCVSALPNSWSRYSQKTPLCHSCSPVTFLTEVQNWKQNCPQRRICSADFSLCCPKPWLCCPVCRSQFIHRAKVFVYSKCVQKGVLGGVPSSYLKIPYQIHIFIQFRLVTPHDPLTTHRLVY